MIYVDRPAWPHRGRLWSHLISDVSYAELHAFAELLGAPRRGFERDHYDIPAERFPVAVWLGARVVPGREIVARLTGVTGNQIIPPDILSRLTGGLLDLQLPQPATASAGGGSA